MTLLCGSVVSKFTGLGTDLNDLALLNDDHALTIGNLNTGAVGDDVVADLCIGRATGDSLAALADQYIGGQRLSIEKLFPLIGKYAAHCTQACFNKSHDEYSFLTYRWCIRPMGFEISAGGCPPAKTGPTDTTSPRQSAAERSPWGCLRRRCGCVAFYSRGLHLHQGLPRRSE